MRELRRLDAGRLPSRCKDQDMFVGVRKMVLTANDMTDTQIHVVGTGGEVVGGHAVGAEEREVFDVIGGFDLLAVDRVGETHLFSQAARDAETKGEGLSGGGSAVALGAGEFAHPGVEQPGLIGTGFFAVVDLASSGVGRGEIAIRQSPLKDRVGDLAMQGNALGLLVLLVPPEVEPAQTFEDGVDGGFGVALDIRVIQAEDHGSSIATGVEPVEDEGAGTPSEQSTPSRSSWR